VASTSPHATGAALLFDRIEEEMQLLARPAPARDDVTVVTVDWSGIGVLARTTGDERYRSIAVTRKRRERSKGGSLGNNSLVAALCCRGAIVSDDRLRCSRLVQSKKIQTGILKKPLCLIEKARYYVTTQEYPRLSTTSFFNREAPCGLRKNNLREKERV